MKYLFLVPLTWAIIWSVSKMVAANNVLRKVALGASRRRAPSRPDPRQEAYRHGVAMVLAELQALERITPAQAEAWGALPVEKVEEQLLTRGAVTREQWDQLWTRHVLPALKRAERPTITMDAELQDALRDQHQKMER